MNEVYLDHVWCDNHLDRQLLLELARISSSMGNWETALVYIREGLAGHNPRDSIAVTLTFMMAQCYMAQKQYNK